MGLMNFKLSDISDIGIGLVLNRRQAQEHNVVKKYRLLTVKSIEEDGWINENELGEFLSIKELDSRYLTQKGDLVIRLSNPNTVISIDESNEDIVISSLFAYIRINTTLILPEYLKILMNSDKLRNYFYQNTYGTGLKTIKISNLNNLNIKVLPMEKQKEIIKLNKLIMEESRLLRDLVKEKDDYHKKLINEMLEGN